MTHSNSRRRRRKAKLGKLRQTRSTPKPLPFPAADFIRALSVNVNNSPLEGFRVALAWFEEMLRAGISGGLFICGNRFSQKRMKLCRFRARRQEKP
jgi:hypothetical protein